MYAKYPNPDATSHYETTKVVDALDRTIIEAGKQVPSNFSITYFDGTASAGVTVNPVKTVTTTKKKLVTMMLVEYQTNKTRSYQGLCGCVHPDLE